MTRYESTLIGVLPDWKTGAGSPPCVHYLRIRPRFGSDPFEQIENQGFYRIRQRSLSWLAVICVLTFRLFGIVGEHSTQAA